MTKIHAASHVDHEIRIACNSLPIVMVLHLDMGHDKLANNNGLFQKKYTLPPMDGKHF